MLKQKHIYIENILYLLFRFDQHIYFIVTQFSTSIGVIFIQYCLNNVFFYEYATILFQKLYKGLYQDFHFFQIKIHKVLLTIFSVSSLATLLSNFFKQHNFQLIQDASVKQYSSFLLGSVALQSASQFKNSFSFIIWLVTFGYFIHKSLNDLLIRFLFCSCSGAQQSLKRFSNFAISFGLINSKRKMCFLLYLVSFQSYFLQSNSQTLLKHIFHLYFRYIYHMLLSLLKKLEIHQIQTGTFRIRPYPNILFFRQNSSNHAINQYTPSMSSILRTCNQPLILFQTKSNFSNPSV
ncbi:unnamed protein product (macronuclear) [Paramecium tetraurelia]|uniref:Transmembrane protein n=1 Tax=Paramecium tetraurelia TaxID=5888 RepID=A0DS81_PARTE|nr:uncharacterized protein GSPATT00019602001 [Paramecium tetraurelia]CAK85898.1 unnamed protein product [Paramecium tetraurelia]|eukprot:XP_001453295.1 hypothetical protein (macronuclear) [Paramecium tetraurelia strain d4-2]